jgi:hypothetical protein
MGEKDRGIKNKNKNSLELLSNGGGGYKVEL